MAFEDRARHTWIGWGKDTAGDCSNVASQSKVECYGGFFFVLGSVHLEGIPVLPPTRRLNYLLTLVLAEKNMSSQRPRLAVELHFVAKDLYAVLVAGHTPMYTWHTKSAAVAAPPLGRGHR